MSSEINKNNDPRNAMDRKEEVRSTDKRLKQDFPGYPHNPASEDEMKVERNWKTDFSNESDTTATGSESIRDEKPTQEQNQLPADEPGGEQNELKTGSDRGLNLHEVDKDQEVRD